MRRNGPNSLPVQELLLLMHEAALDASLWPQVLEGMLSVLHAKTVNLVITGSSLNDFRFEGLGLDPSECKTYNSHFAAIDPWMKEVYRRPELSNASYLPSHSLVGDLELEVAECFQDFYRPRSIYYGFGGALKVPGMQPSLLTVTRAKGKGPFEGEEEKSVLLLLAHLRQALYTHSQMALSRAERDTGFGDPLDKLGRAVLLLDARGKVLRMNRSAEAYAATGDFISVGSNGVVGLTSSQTIAIRGFIEKAIQGKPVSPFPLNDRDGQRTLWATVAGLHRDHAAIRFGVPIPAAALVLVDPARVPEHDHRLLQGIFGLTRTEALVAGMLAKGLSLEMAAGELSIARTTIRTHLKHLFQKTSTSKQGELVALLNRILLLN